MLLYLAKNKMFGPRSYHSWYCDNFLFGRTTTTEELVIYSSIVAVATYVQFVEGRIALDFILVYSFLIIKQTFYNCYIENILNHFYS